MKNYNFIYINLFFHAKIGNPQSEFIKIMRA